MKGVNIQIIYMLLLYNIFFFKELSYQYIYENSGYSVRKITGHIPQSTDNSFRSQISLLLTSLG